MKNQPAPRVSRRDLMLLAGAGGAALLSPAALAGQQKPAPRPAKRGPNAKRCLRIAHLTDIHVQPEKNAPAGFAACLHHVQSQADRPDVIFTGGDSIMDCMGADEARTKAQWDVWQRVLKAECSLPVESCIGNHDVWGWNKKESKTTGREAQWGKRWVMDIFGVEQPYRSFDRAGWHFIFLDSTFPKGGGYTAKLDDRQFEWLAADLQQTPRGTPVCLVSHIPILAACAYFDGDNEESGDWVVPGAWMHTDARKLKNLFKKHPNVKLCLSGHIHLVDRVDYLGVTYLCNGAVSGGWWGGDYQECHNGYGLVDLYADGTFDHRYVTYPWTPPPKE